MVQLLQLVTRSWLPTNAWSFQICIWTLVVSLFPISNGWRTWTTSHTADLHGNSLKNKITQSWVSFTILVLKHPPRVVLTFQFRLCQRLPQITFICFRQPRYHPKCRSQCKFQSFFDFTSAMALKSKLFQYFEFRKRSTVPLKKILSTLVLVTPWRDLVAVSWKVPK